MKRIKKEKFCLRCGKSLVGTQRKFCSKECDILYKKGRKVGPYNEERVRLMVEGKKEVYLQKYLFPIHQIIGNYLNEKYIDKPGYLLNHLKNELKIEGLCEHTLRKYFEEYPEEYALFKKALNFPLKVQQQDYTWFREYKKELEKSVQEGGYVLPLKIKEGSVSEKAKLSVGDIEKSCKVLGYRISEPGLWAQGKPGPKRHTIKYKFGEDVEKGISTRLTTKWVLARKTLEENHFEDLFKEPIVIGVHDELEKFIQEEGKKLGVSSCLCRKYLKEKEVNVRWEYSAEKRAFFKIKKYLKTTDEDAKKLQENLEESLNYYQMRDVLKEFLHNLGYKPLKMDTPTQSIFNFKFEFLKKYSQDISPKFKEEVLKDIPIGQNHISKNGGSTPEKWMIQKLKDLNIPFETQVNIRESKSKENNNPPIYKIDIVIRDKKCLEIQGDYWHSNPLMYSYKITPSKMNSVFPFFKYPEEPNFVKKGINKLQEESILREMKKHSLMVKKYGAENIYYVWEYDIDHFPEEVENFLKGEFLDEARES